MRKDIIKITTILLIMLLWLGCSKNDPSLNATRLRIFLTDAPLTTRAESFTVSEMNVDIQKIEVSLFDTIENSESWITLDYNGGIYNVLELTNGKTKQIVDQYFPSGVLRHIKIVFGDNNNMKTSKGVRNLILDSSASDGIVSDVNANLYANYVTNIIVDINAALSIYELNDNYFLNPSVRAFPETYGGSLKGYVLPIEANPRVFITNKIDTLLTLSDRQDGMFMFKGLDEGEWDIYVLANSQLGYRDTIFSDSVFLGKTTEIKPKIVLKNYFDNEGEEDGKKDNDKDDDGKDNT